LCNRDRSRSLSSSYIDNALRNPGAVTATIDLESGQCRPFRFDSRRVAYGSMGSPQAWPCR
jgi:hypothetical protein